MLLFTICKDYLLVKYVIAPAFKKVVVHSNMATSTGRQLLIKLAPEAKINFNGSVRGSNNASYIEFHY